MLAPRALSSCASCAHCTPTSRGSAMHSSWAVHPLGVCRDLLSPAQQGWPCQRLGTAGSGVWGGSVPALSGDTLAKGTPFPRRHPSPWLAGLQGRSSSGAECWAAGEAGAVGQRCQGEPGHWGPAGMADGLLVPGAPGSLPAQPQRVCRASCSSWLVLHMRKKCRSRTQVTPRSSGPFPALPVASPQLDSCCH